MSDVISFPCDQCENTFQTSKKLMVHVRKADNHEAICKACDKHFTNFDNMRIHKRKYHYEPSEFGKFVCEACGNSYKTKELLRNHRNVVHKVESGLKCNLCRKTLQNILKLKRHMRMCLLMDPEIEVEEEEQTDTTVDEIYRLDSINLSGEASYSVGMKPDEEIEETIVIPETTKEESDLAYFDSIKTEEQPFKEDVHDTYLSDEWDFADFDHHETNIQFFSRDELVEDSTQAKQLDGFINGNAEQQISMEKKDSNVSLIPEKEVKTEHILTENSNLNHICSKCGKGFSTQRKMKHHLMTSHEGQPIVCDVCSKVSKNKHAHRYHQRRVHEKLNGDTKVAVTNDEPKVDVIHKETHICNHCGKVFSTTRKLKHHIITSHEGQAVVCDLCSKTFKNKHAHRNHQRRIHEKKQ